MKMRGQPETVDDLVRVLLNAGFVRCDSAACGCGSWHHRYGYPERMREIKEMLEGAGHPLTNVNGNLLRNALAELIAEREQLRKRGDMVPMLVIVQGAVIVNCAAVARGYGDCLLLHVDLLSKYAAVDYVGSDSDGVPIVYLTTTERTFNVDETKPMDMQTVIAFPEQKGWRIFAATVERYTLALVLLAPGGKTVA